MYAYTLISLQVKKISDKVQDNGSLRVTANMIDPNNERSPLIFLEAYGQNAELLRTNTGNIVTVFGKVSIVKTQLFYPNHILKSSGKNYNETFFIEVSEIYNDAIYTVGNNGYIFPLNKIWYDGNCGNPYNNKPTFADELIQSEGKKPYLKIGIAVTTGYDPENNLNKTSWFATKFFNGIATRFSKFSKGQSISIKEGKLDFEVKNLYQDGQKTDEQIWSPCVIVKYAVKGTNGKQQSSTNSGTNTSANTQIANEEEEIPF